MEVIPNNPIIYFFNDFHFGLMPLGILPLFKIEEFDNISHKGYPCQFRNDSLITSSAANVNFSSILNKIELFSQEMQGKIRGGNKKALNKS